MKQPTYGEDKVYTSYVDLCEDTIDQATQSIEAELEEAVKALICELSDRMMETVEPFEPTDAEIEAMNATG